MLVRKSRAAMSTCETAALLSVYFERIVLNLNIKYRETYDKTTEGKIRELIEDSSNSSDLILESKLENMQTIQDSQGNMMEIGTVISLLLLLVGALNYGNTMAASIQSRKLTFAIMESLGMSDRQIRKLFVREGLLVILCIGVSS